MTDAITSQSLSDFPYPGNEAPPSPLASPSPGVALWWCVTEVSDEAFGMMRDWLSAAEHARAARFGTPALARRYIVGRAALRYVLGAALGRHPVDVAIGRGARGRPRLEDRSSLDFNVSNTRQVALIGVVADPGIRIGVDVEHADRALDHRGLARKFCTPAEQAGMDGLDDDERRQRFVRLWTCKEAMSKATGQALSAPLRHLDVAVEPALRLAGGPPPYSPDDWTLAAAAAPAGYFATVALWRAPAACPDGRTR